MVLEISKIIGTTYVPSSVNQTDVIVQTPIEHLLFRLVVYGSFLGVVDDVYYSPSSKKHLTVRNLVCLTQDGKTVPVRDAPQQGRPVYLAAENDLRKFFPTKSFPDNGYVGFLRGTTYPLPLNIDRLCFANTAILAGIGHGKSHLAAMLVAQYHLTGKKVLVLDPSGEWTTMMEEKRNTLLKMAGLDLKVSCFTGNRIPIIPGDPKNLGPNPPDWIIQMWKALNENNITIVDVSLAHRRDLTAEMKQHARCEIAYHVQQVMMEFALSAYAKTKKSYSVPSCIVLEEAHQFVPSTPEQEYQKLLCPLFSISTKEYRKFGVGHLFIDQSLKAIHESLQIQTFFLGATLQPADLRYLEERLGSNAASAAQRTTGGANSSWAVFGTAAPMHSLPFEIESYVDSDLSFLATAKGALSSWKDDLGVKAHQ